MTIASDNVDPEMLAIPRRWDIRFIMNFMLVFGVLSSVFDYATFGVLLLVLHAGPGEFRTDWFIESVSSAALIVLVVSAFVVGLSMLLAKTDLPMWFVWTARFFLAGALVVGSWFFVSIVEAHYRKR